MEEQTPLSAIPITPAERQRELTSDMELQSVEGTASIERDVSPNHPDTTRKELWGWYMFEFATQPYGTAALGIFLPLILEDLAWRGGTSDPSNPTYPPCADRIDADTLCFVPFGGAYISPISFALYVQAISVLLQAFMFISCGALADYSRWRKVFLIGFATLSSICSILFLAIIQPQWYGFAATLMILSNVFYGTSLVFFNAYLPLLAGADPDVRKLKAELEHQLYQMEMSKRELVPVVVTADPDVIPLTPLDGPPLPTANEMERQVANEDAAHRLHELQDKVSNRISTHAFSVSYLGGLIALGLMAAFIFGMKSSASYLMQICVAFAGVWGLLFMLGFTLPWLHTRPGPSLPASERSYFVYSWKKTFHTIRRASKLKNTFLFLVAWFLYSDGFATIAGVAVLFGKSALNMTSSQLTVIALIAPLCAIVGNYFFLYVFRHWLRFTTQQIVLLLLGLMCLIPVYGLIGFALPSSVQVGVIRTVSELYALGAYYGFLLGAIQSFSRVLYSELIPPGMESEFFALYEITNKGSSWLGPLLVGVMTDSFGQIRYGFIVLLVLMVAALPFLMLMDTSKGKMDARKFVLEDPTTKKEAQAADHEEEVQWEEVQ